MIEEEIAKRFLEILDKNGLTKYEYAKKSSVSKNSIYNLAGGKNLGVHTLNSVCEDMGINLYNFFSYQADDDTVICEDDKEKALVRAYRKLKHDQVIRLMAYLDALTDEELYKK